VALRQEDALTIRKSHPPKFERLKDPLLSRTQFFKRQFRYAGFAIIFVGGSLFAGICGYHFTENLSWLDSFLNAAMILGGMGPVATVQTTAGKIFSGCYALYSGLAVLAAVGILAAPIIHRFLHRFHIDEKTKS
jgi:hypothetical protein